MKSNIISVHDSSILILILNVKRKCKSDIHVKLKNIHKLYHNFIYFGRLESTKFEK